MYNILVSAREKDWESDQRMNMTTSRFREHSGDEAQLIDVNDPQSIKILESVPALLMYEDGVEDPYADVVRVGQLRDIRYGSGNISFRFTETGRMPFAKVKELDHRLQISKWELNRTHWAIKDGDIPQDVLSEIAETPKQYDIVLSFAGEDREYVEAVADYLSEHGVEVFYDRYEEVSLWGKDLVAHLDSIYRKQARYCVMFISSHYAEKVWPKHESRSVLARAIEEKTEYLLPARFDDTPIPGVRPTVGYLDLRVLNPEQLGEAILKKLGRHTG